LNDSSASFVFASICFVLRYQICGILGSKAGVSRLETTYYKSDEKVPHFARANDDLYANCGYVDT